MFYVAWSRPPWQFLKDLSPVPPYDLRRAWNRLVVYSTPRFFTLDIFLLKFHPMQSVTFPLKLRTAYDSNLRNSKCRAHVNYIVIKLAQLFGKFRKWTGVFEWISCGKNRIVASFIDQRGRILYMNPKGLKATMDLGEYMDHTEICNRKWGKWCRWTISGL